MMDKPVCLRFRFSTNTAMLSMLCLFHIGVMFDKIQSKYMTLVFIICDPFPYIDSLDENVLVMICKDAMYMGRHASSLCVADISVSLITLDKSEQHWCHKTASLFEKILLLHRHTETQIHRQKRAPI